jgi:hypothetical protein
LTGGFDKPGSQRHIGTVIGYGIDHQTGNEARTVYLVRLQLGNYLFSNVYVSTIVVHPDSLHEVK